MPKSGLRVLVCGGRDFGKSNMHDRRRLKDALRGVDGGVAILIEGGARGADQLAATWARLSGIEVATYSANWKRDGYAAGPIRNQQMLDEGKPDLVMAFPGGKGTADMVRRARAAGIKVLEPISDERACKGGLQL